MIENKIRSVDDTVCEDCPQKWQGDCTAFQMPHSEAERIFRSIPYPIMNCVVPSPRTRVKLMRGVEPVTEEEAMKIGFLHGAGFDYDHIIRTLVEDDGWTEVRAKEVCEYIQTVDGSFGKDTS